MVRVVANVDDSVDDDNKENEQDNGHSDPKTTRKIIGVTLTIVVRHLFQSHRQFTFPFIEFCCQLL